MIRTGRFGWLAGFHHRTGRNRAMHRLDARPRERIRRACATTARLLLSDRRASLEALVKSGLTDIVFPEIPALNCRSTDTTCKDVLARGVYSNIASRNRI